MSRAAPVLLALVVTAALPGAAGASTEGHGRWRGPLPGGGGDVVGRFAFDRAVPYAAGARRGLDLAAPPGTIVVAPCAGRVAYAGSVPGGRRGVTLACGDLRATELGLATLTVRPGARVRAGAPVGRLGAGGVLRLGARRAGRRHGYVDPAALLAGPAAPRVAPPPAHGRPRARRALPPPAPVRPAEPAARPVRALPWPAWAGLGLLLAGLAGAGATTRRRHRTARARMHAAHRYR